jgi:hypothetical protein
MRLLQAPRDRHGRPVGHGGWSVMNHIEADSACAGIVTLTLGVTLSGVTLYAQLGYLTARSRTIALADGVKFGVIDMGKELAHRAA